VEWSLFAIDITPIMLPKSRRIAEPHAGTDRTRPATRPKVASGSTPEATNLGAALYRRIIATDTDAKSIVAACPWSTQ